MTDTKQAALHVATTSCCNSRNSPLQQLVDATRATASFLTIRKQAKWCIYSPPKGGGYIYQLRLLRELHFVPPLWGGIGRATPLPRHVALGEYPALSAAGVRPPPQGATYRRRARLAAPYPQTEKRERW